MSTKQKITTFLWFDGNAEQAVEHYLSIFPGSRVTQKGPMTIAFELAGQGFVALNGGPHYKFTPAISLYVSCEDQAEVDTIWGKFIAAGGKESRCGWLEDKFGLSWQIIPKALVELMTDPDPNKAGRVAEAMMGMQKINVAALERAHRG